MIVNVKMLFSSHFVMLVNSSSRKTLLEMYFVLMKHKMKIFTKLKFILSISNYPKKFLCDDLDIAVTIFLLEFLTRSKQTLQSAFFRFIYKC